MNKYVCLFVSFVICNFGYEVTEGLDWPPFAAQSNDSDKEWLGRWFPQPPDKAVDDNPSVDMSEVSRNNLQEHRHGIQMGIPTEHCDDGKINITLDWDSSPIDYTCFENKYEYLPNLDVHPILHSDHIPKEYNAPHKCMDTPIFYEEDIPTFGTHRPLWPKWGEYIFLPKQRWLHALEHGAVTMLYHPCANKQEVQLLKKLVTGCLYRHIITPYNLLKPDRPLALVAWGNRFLMSKVDPQLVVEFIRNFALRGPEQKYDDGQFDFGLIKHSKMISDKWDHELCPSF